MLALLMPSSIEIVEPFTRVEAGLTPGSPQPSFELELMVRASNALDNPGLMIVGDVRVELYQYLPGSAEPKGEQYVRWMIPLADEEDQRTHWNPVTQMYEFRLGLREALPPAGERYVILVTYNSPLGEHLTDEYVIMTPRRGGLLGEPAGG